MLFRALFLPALLFLSGGCALVYQSAWLREFRLVFGGSTAATGAVLAVFMAGLGIGNALLGVQADRARNPLARYALLEFFIALTAAFTPWLLDFCQLLYVRAGGQSALGLSGATAARLALAGLVLGPPTILMGGTLPAAARAITRGADTHRRYLALLYGMNTLGAVAGVLVSTFFLLESLGTRGTLWLACAINTIVALVAWKLAHRPYFSVPTTSVEAPAVSSTHAISPETNSNAYLPWSAEVYFASALVGFAFFLMEIVWFRMLGPLLGGTTFTFGLILATALTGIGIGGALYPFIVQYLRPSRHTFALTCTLEAFLLAIPLAFGDALALKAGEFREDLGASFVMVLAGWGAIAGIVILPVAIVSGFQFPLLIALLGKAERGVGRQVGLAFAFNTVGSILGSLAGGFGLLPALSAPGAWRFAVVLLTAQGLATLIVASLRDWQPRSQTVTGLAAIGALACFLAMGPTAVWRHSQINAIPHALPADRSPNGLQEWKHHQRRNVLWEADGTECSVAIWSDKGLAFVVNGKVDGSTVADASTQVMLSLLGAMLHPDPHRAMVIGLGTGQSAGWLAEAPTMERVDVVELEPALDEIARRAASTNFNVLQHPKVKRYYNDAREVLATSRVQYDLIASEPSNPYRSGIAALFTREFYRCVRERLAPGGIFTQWIQLYSISPATVGSVLRTLRTEFAEVELWQSNSSDLLLLCSQTPISHDLPALRARLGLHPYRQALAETWRAIDSEGFFSHFVAGSRSAAEIAARPDAVVNTDDRNVVEYGFARTVGAAASWPLEQIRDLAVTLNDHRPRVPVDGLDWSEVRDLQQLDYVNSLDRAYKPPTSLNADASKRAVAMVNFIKLDLPGVIAAWESQPKLPRQITEFSMLGLAYADQGNDQALPLADKLQMYEPVEAHTLRALYFRRKKQLSESHSEILKAFAELRKDPWFHPQVVQTVVNISYHHANDHATRAPEMARAVFASLSEPFAMNVFHDLRQKAAVSVASRVGVAESIEAMNKLEPYVPWNETILSRRAEILRATKSPRFDAAQADLDRYRKQARIQIGRR